MATYIDQVAEDIEPSGALLIAGASSWIRLVYEVSSVGRIASLRSMSDVGWISGKSEMYAVKKISIRIYKESSAGVIGLALLSGVDFELNYFCFLRRKWETSLI